MENLELYEKVREVPKEAQKTIGGGRLKGFTDINPMWRIQKLTECFGPCGLGWYIDVKDKWIDRADNGEQIASVMIELYIKNDNGTGLTPQWSKPIVGVGGSRFVSNEKNGPSVSDECFKMALTDAISVACKNLGFGADIYWSQGRTKYDQQIDRNKYPTRLQMLDVIRQHYPEGEALDGLLSFFKTNSLEKLSDEQLFSVFKKYAS